LCVQKVWFRTNCIRHGLSVRAWARRKAVHGTCRRGGARVRLERDGFDKNIRRQRAPAVAYRFAVTRKPLRGRNMIRVGFVIGGVIPQRNKTKGGCMVLLLSTGDQTVNEG